MKSFARLVIGMLANAATVACILPEATSDITVGGETISPATTHFAVVAETFDQFFGSDTRADVAVVLMGNLACEDIPTDCEAPAATAHATLRIILNESLFFGQTQLGDYDVPQEGGFSAQLTDGSTPVALQGNIDLLAIDDSRLVATYDVNMTGDEQVTGEVVAEACPAFEENRLACE